MGENGSGKSTLIKVISGVYQPDSGEIMLNGNLYHKLNPAESVRQGVQIIYQDFTVFPNLTVAENIIFGQKTTVTMRFIPIRTTIITIR